MTDAFDLEPPFAEPEAPAEPPTEPHPNRVVFHMNGMTIDLDMHELLTALDPQGRYVGYDPEQDEAHYEPSSFAIVIADLTAQHLTKMMHRDVKARIEDEVHAAVTGQVGSIVGEALAEGTLQATNEYGGKIGEARPLKEIIVTTATDALTKQTGDSYGRGGRQTMVQKIISEQVNAAFTKELQTVVTQAKEQALAVVQQEAAKVIKDTIERSTQGLGGLGGIR